MRSYVGVIVVVCFLFVQDDCSGAPPIAPTESSLRRGRGPRRTGRPGPIPTGIPKTPTATESIVERLLDQIKQHERNVLMDDGAYAEQNDQDDETEVEMHFERRLRRTTAMPDFDIMKRGRATEGPSPPPFPGNPNDGREALKEFIWNLTTEFPSGPMSDTFNLAVDEVVEKIKTAFQQYPAVPAPEILSGLYLDLGITILTKKAQCPASKFAHAMIYMLRMEMEDDLGDEDDSLKSELASILSTTNLTYPDEYAEHMVHGLHHAIFREMIFNTARSLTKDTHRTLMFLRKKLLNRLPKPAAMAVIRKMVQDAIQKFPKVGRCVTAQELVEWHKNRKTEFNLIKNQINMTAVMEFLRFVLTASLKNITGNDYPTQVQSILGVLKSYIGDVMDLAEKFYDHVIAQDMNKMVALFDDLDDAEKSYFKDILKKLGFTSTGSDDDDDDDDDDDKRELDEGDPYERDDDKMELDEDDPYESNDDDRRKMDESDPYERNDDKMELDEDDPYERNDDDRRKMDEADPYERNIFSHYYRKLFV